MLRDNCRQAPAHVCAVGDRVAAHSLGFLVFKRLVGEVIRCGVGHTVNVAHGARHKAPPQNGSFVAHCTEAIVFRSGWLQAGEKGIDLWRLTQLNVQTSAARVGDKYWAVAACSRVARGGWRLDVASTGALGVEIAQVEASISISCVAWGALLGVTVASR